MGVEGLEYLFGEYAVPPCRAPFRTYPCDAHLNPGLPRVVGVLTLRSAGAVTSPGTTTPMTLSCATCCLSWKIWLHVRLRMSGKCLTTLSHPSN